MWDKRLKLWKIITNVRYECTIIRKSQWLDVKTHLWEQNFMRKSVTFMYFYLFILLWGRNRLLYWLYWTQQCSGVHSEICFFSPIVWNDSPPPYIKHISTRQHSLALCVHLCIGTQYLRRQSFLAPLNLGNPSPMLAFALPLWIYIAKQCINNVLPQRRLSPLSFSLHLFHTFCHIPSIPF